MTVRSSEIWEIEVQIDHSPDIRRKFDLSFRLWSEHIPIASLLKRSSFKAAHCHYLGETIVIGGRSTNRVARRHYASLQNFETNDVEGLSDWLVDTQKRLDKNGEILLGLKSGQIEGVIWIALFGDGVQALPYVDPTVTKNYFGQRVRILFENYTDIDMDGLPRKTWLTV